MICSNSWFFGQIGASPVLLLHNFTAVAMFRLWRSRSRNWKLNSPRKKKRNIELRTSSWAVVVAQPLSTRLATEKSWVRILRVQGMFSLLYPLSSASLIQDRYGGAQQLIFLFIRLSHAAWGKASLMHPDWANKVSELPLGLITVELLILNTSIHGPNMHELCLFSRRSVPAQHSNETDSVAY